VSPPSNRGDDLPRLGPATRIPRSKQGFNAVDIVRSRPATRTRLPQQHTPAEDTSVSRTESYIQVNGLGPGYFDINLDIGLRSTYGVPTCSASCDFANPKNSKQDRHFRALHGVEASRVRGHPEE
jgi:hypothetical protein